MLREYSKINDPTQVLKTDRIVLWKGGKKDIYYVKGISVD
ncbi:hypothetical protein SAMN05216167_1514 [Spirosoma endophyticum]|uniref:Uncharacterized protein n=1 Tax=Spirosoma endophyticum TaxID=662367 RepID=A0A1I2HX98_9BACT|nr:hypothetical protein SAMN05216167_1514 [Spirosoma endophyticum]